MADTQEMTQLDTQEECTEFFTCLESRITYGSIDIVNDKSFSKYLFI
jgi:hypothetical protein